MPGTMETFICLILLRWRSHFYDHWYHPVFLFIPCIFSGTVNKNEKHFLLFSFGISSNTTVAKDPNDFFLLLFWQQKWFHLLRSNCNLNCFLIHRYIYFPVFFFAIVFILLQRDKYRFFKVQLWKEQRQICFLYKLG